MSNLKALARPLLWPLLLTGCIGLTVLALASDSPTLGFNAVYLGLAVCLFYLERWLPYEPTWLGNDGQMPVDLAHTLASKGIVQVLVVMIALIGLGGSIEAGALWPSHWHPAAQVLLGLIAMEFGLYWAHRLAHEWPRVWRFHAIHHSVRRLWFFNTGRFHVIDTLWSLALGLPLITLMGAPGTVLIWVSAITAFVGLLTHCNVDMRCGPLNYLFNTPQLHRWHHSMNPEEGNRNYGENLVLWDQLFGTFYWSTRRPPTEIGVSDPVPPNFLGQVAWPFRRS